LFSPHRCVSGLTAWRRGASCPTIGAEKREDNAPSMTPQRPGRATEIISLSAGESEETEIEMQVLIITFGLLAAVWIIVLWGSRYFGPR
jgi:hypothetical protein